MVLVQSLCQTSDLVKSESFELKTMQAKEAHSTALFPSSQHVHWHPCKWCIPNYTWCQGHWSSPAPQCMFRWPCVSSLMDEVRSWSCTEPPRHGHWCSGNIKPSNLDNHCNAPNCNSPILTLCGPSESGESSSGWSLFTVILWLNCHHCQLDMTDLTDKHSCYLGQPVGFTATTTCHSNRTDLNQVVSDPISH